MSKLALLGGHRTKTKPFPQWPMYDEEERRALVEVLETGVWWRTPGLKLWSLSVRLPPSMAPGTELRLPMEPPRLRS